MTALLLFGLPLLFFAISIRLIKSESEVRRDVGKSLLTGSIVAFAVFALQLHLDAKRRGEEKREQFRFSVSFAENLNGLKPEYPLSQMYLSGKSLNGAELQRQDLTEANLQGASLRGADLEGADLDRANLFGVDLTGANLDYATFDGADLRAARLGETRMAIPPEPGDFRGVEVNGRTCWPEDMVANVHYSSAMQDALIRRPVKRRGRTTLEADSERSWGRACSLSDENLVQDLELYASVPIEPTIAAGELRQTAHRLAVTFGRNTASILTRFERGRPMSDFGPAAPALQPRLCAGSRRLEMQAAEFNSQEFGVLVVRRPDQPPGNTVLIRHPLGLPFHRYTILFAKPLSAGTELALVVERPDGATFDRYISRRRVVPC